jgi:sucrose-6-phosphate hydrolase SacC (GH32 family)
MQPVVSTAPRVHFTPPSGWMNDPNGLVFFEGEWHLFYQYTPPGAPGKHWGHAVSRDLVHWEHLPIALFPDACGEIFSGSAVVDVDDSSGFFDGGSGLVAIFTYHLSDTQPQSQGIAWSSDRGRTWTKYAGNPVLAGAKIDFRDPKVFRHEPSGAWIMVLAAGNQVEIYRSPNLREWSFASAFGEHAFPENLCWECPDLFPLRDEQGREVWVLSCSFLDRANFRGQVAACETHYFAGDFNGHAFRPRAGEAPRRLTWGPDDYAAVTYNDAPGGRRILLGWLNHWGYCWHSGQMTVPRELRWRDGGIVQSLPAEVQQARDWPRVKIEQASALGVTVPCEIEIAADTLSWRLEAHQGDALVFSLAREAGRGAWIFQRGHGGFPAGWEKLKPHLDKTFTAPIVAPLGPQANGTRVLIDSCSVEAFCDGGAAFFSAQVFPPAGDWRISWQPLAATGSPAQG